MVDTKVAQRPQVLLSCPRPSIAGVGMRNEDQAGEVLEHARDALSLRLPDAKRVLAVPSVLLHGPRPERRDGRRPGATDRLLIRACRHGAGRVTIDADGPHLLVVSGDADRWYDPAGTTAVVGATGGSSLVIAGANHSLEVEGDVLATIEGFRRLAEAVLAFMADGSADRVPRR